MAGSKSTQTKAKRQPSRNTAAEKRAERAAAQKQVAAIILFCVSAFLICVTLIPGGGLWGGIRTLSFGLFGFSAFLVPLLLLYVAIMTTLDKAGTKVGFKVAEAMALIVLLCSALHIFRFSGEVDFFADIADAYNTYRIDGSMLGSGAVGSVFGGLILLATGSGKAAAIAIVIILLFLCIMLMTGTTLIKLFRGVAKPVQKANAYREEKIEQITKQQEREFNVDVDLGPEPIVTDEKIKKFPKKKKGDEAQVTETLENADALTPAQEPVSQKPILLDDIINKMKGEEAAKQTVPEDGIIPISAEKFTKDDKNAVSTPDADGGLKASVKHIEDGDSEQETDGESPKKVYEKPPLTCLAAPKNARNLKYEDELKANATKLVDTLKSFGVETRIVDICRGPSVTRYEIQPAAGVKISRITNLADDIALNLAAGGIRIEAPIPNKAAVGIEVPNKNRATVTFREIVDTEQYKSAKSKLFVALGKDIAGNCMYADLAKMPHLLVAGTTGSGKSVCMNAMIVSILYNATPDEVKLLMIDPKQVEFTVYNGIPHLIVPVVSDPRKASGALAWAVTEMLTRYKMFSDNNVRDISGYNSICESIGQKKLPQIVIFIDELSDLMMAAPHEVEDSICRLAQMARAAGMHLVIATQRPSVDVITGLIKANIPSRLSLKTSSQIDSRTIIDTVGAEKLLGNGDMLFYPVGIAKPIRIQGCFLSDKEVETVVDFIKGQEQTSYDDDVMQEIERQAAADKKKNGGAVASDEDGESEADEMIPKAIEVVVDAQMASTTLLQRKLKLGYARAARIIDNLEERGIIGPYEGAKPRKVPISKQQWYEMNALAQGGATHDYSESDTDTVVNDAEE
ncbi:MAG: DNA translocase FtsK [Candidatus Fimenecus sp.]